MLSDALSGDECLKAIRDDAGFVLDGLRRFQWSKVPMTLYDEQDDFPRLPIRKSAMANEKPEVTKSQAIRDILEKNPKMPNKEIVSTLAQQGIKVSDTYVYMVKGKAHAKKQKAKRQKAIEASNESGVVNPVKLIVGVRQLAASAGGIRKLKELVDILAE
jgi:hypothetical protein